MSRVARRGSFFSKGEEGPNLAARIHRTSCLRRKNVSPTHREDLKAATICRGGRVYSVRRGSIGERNQGRRKITRSCPVLQREGGSAEADSAWRRRALDTVRKDEQLHKLELMGEKETGKSPKKGTSRRGQYPNNSQSAYFPLCATSKEQQYGV